jgi:hypothetical protein
MNGTNSTIAIHKPGSRRTYICSSLVLGVDPRSSSGLSLGAFFPILTSVFNLRLLPPGRRLVLFVIDRRVQPYPWVVCDAEWQHRLLGSRGPSIVPRRTPAVIIRLSIQDPQIIGVRHGELGFKSAVGVIRLRSSVKSQRIEIAGRQYRGIIFIDYALAGAPFKPVALISDQGIVMPLPAAGKAPSAGGAVTGVHSSLGEDVQCIVLLRIRREARSTRHVFRCSGSSDSLIPRTHDGSINVSKNAMNGISEHGLG